MGEDFIPRRRDRLDVAGHIDGQMLGPEYLVDDSKRVNVVRGLRDGPTIPQWSTRTRTSAC